MTPFLRRDDSAEPFPVSQIQELILQPLLILKILVPTRRQIQSAIPRDWDPFKSQRRRHRTNLRIGVSVPCGIHLKGAHDYLVMFMRICSHPAVQHRLGSPLRQIPICQTQIEHTERRVRAQWTKCFPHRMSPHLVQLRVPSWSLHADLGGGGAICMPKALIMQPPSTMNYSAKTH